MREVTKFFDADGREVTPNKAVKAVKVTIDDEGEVAHVSTYFVSKND